jgi:ubiquinone/menaquinone biosynthesis C-methylase UbiE
MTSTEHVDAQQSVRDFWQRQSCGEVYANGADAGQQFDAQAEARYQHEPFIFDFARFHEGIGKDVLEIGVGMGADHLHWAQSSPRSLTGIDLTDRAIVFTNERLRVAGLKSNLLQADAEKLPFEDDSFDLVYSWGVLHHSPNTQQAIDEVYRVLRPGGRARVMIYQKHAVVGYLLWLRYGLLAGRPFRSLDDVYASHLESPGTKAYTRQGALRLFRNSASIELSTALSVGDLMEGAAGQRHRGALLSIAKRLWPRWLIKRCLSNFGLFLMIEAVKDGQSEAQRSCSHAA